MNAKLILVTILAEIISIRATNAHERVVRQSPRRLTSVFCRKNAEMCVDTLCLEPQFSFGCLDSDVKGEMLRRLKNCKEPTPEECVANLPLRANRNPIFISTIIPSNWVLTPENCRRDPNMCVDVLCLRPQYTVGCMDRYVKSEMLRRLGKCTEPTPEQCIIQLPLPANIQRVDVHAIIPNTWALTPVNCRRDPNMCVDVLCRRPQYTVGCMDRYVKSEMLRRLGKCREPTPEECIVNLPLPANINPIYVNPIFPHNGSGSYCRTNAAYCVNKLCQLPKFQWRCHDTNVRQQMIIELGNCFKSTAEECLESFPAVGNTRASDFRSGGFYCGTQINYCTVLACNKLAAEQNVLCSTPHVKSSLQRHLALCKVFDLDSCVDDFVQRNNYNGNRRWIRIWSSSWS